MCPVCTVTVIAGLGISRLLGIDDLITSLWIGAFILSFSFITVSWLEKSRWREKIYKHICRASCGITPLQDLKFWVIFLTYLLVLVPLYLDHTIGIKRNTFWGIDKVILGIGVGSVVFLIGVWVDKMVRKGRGGKQLFHFQKVVFPVLTLIITSLIFYFVTKH